MTLAVRRPTVAGLLQPRLLLLVREQWRVAARQVGPRDADPPLGRGADVPATRQVVPRLLLVPYTADGFTGTTAYTADGFTGTTAYTADGFTGTTAYTADGYTDTTVRVHQKTQVSLFILYPILPCSTAQK